MNYTVVVKEIYSSNGDYNRYRYNDVSQKIVKFLLKNGFSFTVGIFNNIVNGETSETYIEIFTKSVLGLTQKSYDNELANEKLFELLNRIGKKGHER